MVNTQNQIRLLRETKPTKRRNPSLPSVTTDGSGRVVTVDMKIQGITYRKTITYGGGLPTVSEWVQV